MTLPNSQKRQDFSFKAFENEEKDIKLPYNVIRNELTHMAKKIKNVMKFNRKIYKNQEYGKGKRP